MQGRCNDLKRKKIELKAFRKEGTEILVKGTKIDFSDRFNWFYKSPNKAKSLVIL